MLSADLSLPPSLHFRPSLVGVGRNRTTSIGHNLRCVCQGEAGARPYSDLIYPCALSPRFASRVNRHLGQVNIRTGR